MDLSVFTAFLLAAGVAQTGGIDFSLWRHPTNTISKRRLKSAPLGGDR